MKILQVNVVYKNGSTGSIVEQLHNGLVCDGYDSVVCYGRGEKTNEKNVYKICSELESKLCHAWSYICGISDAGFLFSTHKLKRIIMAEKPDIVHLHCLNGYFVNVYRLLNWLKAKKIKTVLTLHAEFMYTGGCAHSVYCEKWRNGENCDHCEDWRNVTGSFFFNRTGRIFDRLQSAFSGFGKNIRIVSVSPWVFDRARSSPVLKHLKHSVVLNGLDTSVFKPYNTDDLKKDLGLVDKKVIFHPTACFSDEKGHIKGGYYLIELAKALKNENIVFFVAGIYKEGIKVPDNVVLLGRINNRKELASYYSMADLTVLTSLRETFSMVVSESLSCGTPVVGFKAGAPEQIAIKEYSRFVDNGDVDALKIAVLEWINNKDEKISLLAHQKYGSEQMYDEYKNVYYDLSGENI